VGKTDRLYRNFRDCETLDAAAPDLFLDCSKIAEARAKRLIGSKAYISCSQHRAE